MVQDQLSKATAKNKHYDILINTLTHRASAKNEVLADSQYIQVNNSWRWSVFRLPQSPVLLIFVVAIAGHVAFWRFLPNPVPSVSRVIKSEKISTIPVVTLPINLLNGQDHRLSKFSNRLKLPQINSSQIKLPPNSALSNLPQPNGLQTLPPPPLLSLPPQNLPQNSAFKTPPNLSSNLMLPPPSTLPNSKVSNSTNLNFAREGSNLKLDVNNSPDQIPSLPLANNVNSNLIDNSTNTKYPGKEPTPKQLTDPETGYSLKASDLILPKNIPTNKNINKDN